MRIQETINGNIMTIRLTGSLDDASSHMVESRVNEIMTDEKVGEVNFDFSDLHYISSIGIRVLILAYKKAVKLGKTVIVTEMSDKVRIILKMVGILPIFSPGGVKK